MIYSSQIYIDIFFADVKVIIVDSSEELHKEIEGLIKEQLHEDEQSDIENIEALKKYFPEDEPLTPGAALDVSHSDGSTDVFVVFQGEPEKIRTGVIIHEMHHAKSKICEHKGIDDEETEAYMIEYLCDKMFWQIGEFKKEHKKVKKKG